MTLDTMNLLAVWELACYSDSQPKEDLILLLLECHHQLGGTLKGLPSPLQIATIYPRTKPWRQKLTRLKDYRVLVPQKEYLLRLLTKLNVTISVK